MVLVGAAILPHGSLVLDPSLGSASLPAGSIELHQACIGCASHIRAMQPDIIILHTPHGLCLGNNLGVYLNPSAAGSAEWMGGWRDFRVSVRLHHDRAAGLLQHLQKKDVPADGVIAFAGFDAPLRWAEVVPLWFTTRAMGGDNGTRDETVGSFGATDALPPPPPPPADGAGKSNARGPQFVILSEGCGGSTGASSADRARTSPGKIPETLRTGREIKAWADAQPERILFLASVDLAHGHGNGRCPAMPDGRPDPRFLNPKYDTPLRGAAPFDEAMVEWASTLASTPLLETAPPLVSITIHVDLELFIVALCVY